MKTHSFRKTLNLILIASLLLGSLLVLSPAQPALATPPIEGNTVEFVDSGQALAGATNNVALGDLDSDGDLDAFFANQQQSDTVWRNDGSGTFTSIQSLDDGAGNSSYDVALGDLDSDGDLDAFVANIN